jgi:hypothetical protein
MDRKTIFKYLAECIFIFIGVIAAFLFDNARERRQLKDQELDLLRDVSIDLANDTIRYNRLIADANNLKNKLTELIRSLEATNNEAIDDYALKFTFAIDLDKTIFEEIKSTGGFRFIEDKELVKELLTYYQDREFVANQIQTKFFDRVDQRMYDFIDTQSKFVDDKMDSVTKISYKIDQESIDRLRGNQKLINLCYEKRGYVIMVTENALRKYKKTCKRLHTKCETYIMTKN